MFPFFQSALSLTHARDAWLPYDDPTAELRQARIERRAFIHRGGISVTTWSGAPAPARFHEGWCMHANQKRRRTWRIKGVQKLAELAAQLPVHARGCTLGPGRGHSKKPTDRLPGSRGEQSRLYLARRIAKERPDILARMLAGEFEYVAQAAKAAGVLKQKKTHDSEKTRQQ